MFNRKKIGSTSHAAKKENRFLRLLRPDTSFQPSPFSLERRNQEQPFQECQKAIENAMLAAEYNRAKAIMASQQARSYC